MNKIYHLFISHSWTYSDQYQRLINMLNTSANFNYKNFSVPKNDPIHNAKNDTELNRAIRSQMSSAGVVIILAGVYASYSKWINKEIELAKNGFMTRKPILAIEPWGSERTSKIVKDSADKIVAWNTISIISAIKEMSK